MIFLKDLILDCAIGVYEHEKTKRQKVRFNVEVEVMGTSQPVADEIGQVLSYAKIADGIKELAAGPHINLVETLAERVAALCLADRRALRARVRVEKLEIEPDAAAVGVEITRSQPADAPEAGARDPVVTALTFPPANRPKPILTVLKIGGSLAKSSRLMGWQAAIAACPHRLVVVPGGGPFADQVRTLQSHWRFDESLAHHLAITAMEQYGRMLAGISTNLVPADSRTAIRRALAEGKVPVWMPCRMVIGRPEVPESWEVTSDSLAAWLTNQLNARRLVLVKSRRPKRDTASLDELVCDGLIDPAFPRFFSGQDVRAWCLAADENNALPDLLDSSTGGTEILPRHDPRGR